MDAKKRKKLEKLGGRITTTQEFLGLTDAEAAIVELRLELAAALRCESAASPPGLPRRSSQKPSARASRASPRWKAATRRPASSCWCAR